jgi:hypothetical protein
MATVQKALQDPFLTKPGLGTARDSTDPTISCKPARSKITVDSARFSRLLSLIVP